MQASRFCAGTPAIPGHLTLAEAARVAVHAAFLVDERRLAAAWTQVGADGGEGELDLDMSVG